MLEKLKQNGIRAEFDNRNEKVGLKIREATLRKEPYMIIIGDKEKESNTITVRTRSGKDLGSKSIETFIDELKKEISDKV